MEANKMKIIDIVTQSREIFFKYGDICNKKYRQNDSLRFYRDLIDSHRNANNINDLLASDDFLKKVYATLEEWNMNQRGARLVSLAVLSDSIRSFRELLAKLYMFRIEELSEVQIQEVLNHLKGLFCGLEIMATKRRIVGVSKAIHFLLPALTMPIDGAYTLPAFYGYNRYADSEVKEFKIYSDIFIKSYRIAKRLNLTNSDVTGQAWCCSIPKLIDNAIFGRFIEAKEILESEKIKRAY